MVTYGLLTHRPCDKPSLRAQRSNPSVIARSEATKQTDEAISSTANVAGSASPPCLHNVGYGRPATNALSDLAGLSNKLSLRGAVITRSRHCEERSDEANLDIDCFAALAMTAQCDEGLCNCKGTWRRSAVVDVVQAWRRGRACGTGLGIASRHVALLLAAKGRSQ